MSELHDAIRRAMEAQGTPEPEPVRHPVATTNDVQEIPPVEPHPPVMQPTLFDPPVFDGAASVAARDVAMANVEAAAHPDWKADANRALRTLVERGHEFTADDLWAEVGYFPRERRALGPLLKRFADNGEIVNTGKRRNSTRPEHHAYPMTVWRPA